jgi:ABC-type Zn uptake system ZnuABC Zn-binding protein ZnuA
MMTRYIIVFLLQFFMYLAPAEAKTLVSCSHIELCRVAKIIFAENHNDNFEFQSLVTIMGDPHEFEPTTSEIKNLIQAKILISGPLELNPWIKKVNYQRSKLTNLITINVPLEDKDYAQYLSISHEPLSHFWLYPKIFCALKSHMEDQFVHLKYIPNISKNNLCELMDIKISKELKETIKKLNLPIVLTHDALQPLLESLSTNSEKIVAIKGSGHHTEASPQTVKKLYDALSAPKVVWIIEKNISVPQNILSKKRKEDLEVKIDTANSNGLNYFQVLQTLNDQLKALK